VNRTFQPWFRQALCAASARGAIAALALLPAAAWCAESPDALHDSFHIALGTFIVNADTKLRLDGDVGEQGTDIDWEKTFGDSDVSRFRMDGYWRFADRHKIRALLFSSSYSASKTIEEDIDFDGETFPARASVDGRIKFSIYELAYEYAFVRRANYEVAASFGLHYTDFETSLEATLESGGGAANTNIEKSGSVGAPLPVFGLRGTWLLSKTFSIDVSGQYFSMSYGDVDGSLQDYRALLNWQPKSWLGLGVGYDNFSVDVNVDSTKFAGKMDWTYHGPMIFYSASF
jgi:hypothetical protein